jgi:phage-related protein
VGENKRSVGVGCWSSTNSKKKDGRKKRIGEMDRDRKRESRISFIFFFIFDQEEEDEDNESKSRIRRSRTPFDVIYLWIYVLGPLSLDLKERFSSAHILNF